MSTNEAPGGVNLHRTEARQSRRRRMVPFGNRESNPGRFTSQPHLTDRNPAE
jgi:hypothetical protein